MPGIIELISGIQQMKQGRTKAYLDVQKTLAGIAEKNPEFANYLSKQMYGTEPFKGTKVGETVTKTPESKGMFGTETTILPGREVRTGGYEVPPEVAEMFKTAEAIKGMKGKEVPAEAFMKKYYGWEKKKEEKPSTLAEKKIMLEETLALPDYDPRKQPTLKMLGALLESNKSNPVEIGYGKGQMIKAYYDQEKQEWIYVGKPYARHAPKEGEKYTLAQLEDDARAHCDSLHGSLMTQLNDAGRTRWLTTYSKYIRDNSWKLTDPTKRAEIIKRLGDPLGIR